MKFPILTVLLALPLVGAILISFIQSHKVRWIQGVAVGVAGLTFVLSLFLWGYFQPQETGFQFVEHYAWFPEFGISYSLGIDGLSLFLIILTTFLSPIVLVSAIPQIKKHIKEFYIVYLLLETGMLGVFMALDLVLFYIFWEVMLIPMYLIIGIWGGGRRIYAAVKFFIYTALGSLVMLLAILYLGIHYKTFHVEDLARLAPSLPLKVQLYLFAAFALSFAIKVPTFPFHTWLPDAHVEAPTGGSVILAGVLLKMGVYGFLRFCFPLFPEAVVVAAPWMCAIGVIGIIYGALLAYAQTDLKKLVAYSSISHLGFVVLAIFSLSPKAVSGGVYQMLNHGISTGALFLLVGVIYERRHTRLIADYGGIASQVPVYATLFMIILLSSIGLPPLNGFVGEFLILLGTFETFPYFAGVAVLGVVLGAIYMLSMYRRVFFGRLDNPENARLEDVNRLECLTLVPLAVLVFVMGLFPNIFLSTIHKSSEHLVKGVVGKKVESEKTPMKVGKK